MTLKIDDAGVGDLLLGALIGAYRLETGEFSYDMIEVEYFKPPDFGRKRYLKRASEIVFELLEHLRLREDEQVQICSSFVLEKAVKDLRKKLGEDRVEVVKITGDAQRYAETAYLDELHNLGYEPLLDRENRRARSFFHMLSWVKKDPSRLRYAKTGWPRLRRYIRVKR